jgi:hypothetical protein
MTITDTPARFIETDESQLLFKEARRRRRRRVGTVIVLAVVTALVIGVVASVGGKGVLQNPTAAPTGAARFIPPTTTSGAVTSMALRLPDGRGFDLSYPTSLDLSPFTLTAGGQVNWAVQTSPLKCCGVFVAPHYGTVSSVFSGKPIAVYQGLHGQAVPYFAGTQERFPLLYANMDYLAFQFGPWVVLVGDMAHSSYGTARMTNAERTTWARSFDAYITQGGYLVYRPHAPLTVSRGPIVFSHAGGSLEISGPVGCTAPLTSPTVNAGITSWCDPRSQVRVAATGTVAFTKAAASRLHIAPLRPVS